MKVVRNDSKGYAAWKSNGESDEISGGDAMVIVVKGIVIVSDEKFWENIIVLRIMIGESSL